MGSKYTYPAGRIAGEVAVFDSQGPAVPDRSAVLQEICTQQLVQNGGRNIASEGTITATAELPVKLPCLTVRVP
jgi:hypothetical protein